MVRALLVTLAAVLLAGAVRDGRPRGLYPTIGGVYETTSVTGDVRVWRRYGANWRQVLKGDRLAQGELLQFAAGASIRVRGVVSGAGEPVPRGFTIQTDDPLLTRVEETSFRSLELGGYFIPIKGVESDDKKEEEAPPTFRSAWERMVALFDEKGANEAKKDDLAETLDESDQEDVTDEAQEIKIDHPRSGDTYIVETLPTDVAVSWSKLPPGVRGLKVFFWRAEHGSPTPVGQTDESFFRLPVMAGGRYYVRVESPDGRWRSKAHLFIIITADQISTKREPKKP